MEQRLSVITLGVRDLRVSAAFYAALGWSPGGAPADADVVFFQAPGVVLALWSRTALGEDSCVVDTGGWGGVTLAHNVREPAEVDAVLATATAAGARLGRAGAPTAWGGYSGVFCDPVGHPWEVAHNPFWRITDDGATLLGTAGEDG
jgi:predicted lactoylglutathione lyase